MKNTICYVTVPCYNEEEMLPLSAPVFVDKINTLVAGGQIAPGSKVLFIDDGSGDKTWQIIEQLHQKFPQVAGLKLSRNCGHQNALLAGLLYAKEKVDIPLFRQSLSRVCQYYLFHLAYRGTTTVCHQYYRGIYRQNLFGNQTPPALHY